MKISLAEYLIKNAVQTALTWQKQARQAKNRPAHTIAPPPEETVIPRMAGGTKRSIFPAAYQVNISPEAMQKAVSLGNAPFTNMIAAQDTVLT